MVKAEYILFCEGKSLGENGKLTIQGIFESAYAGGFPAQIHPMKAAFRLVPTKGPIVDKELDLKIVAVLNEKEVCRLEASLRATVEKDAGIVLDIDLKPFVYPEPGVYQIQLHVDNKLLIERPFYLRSATALVEK